MDIAPKALYNSLRMSFLQEKMPQQKMPTIERWKVEDYRNLPLDELFRRLEAHKIVLDRQSFVAFAAEYDSPEDFFDDLAQEQTISLSEADQVYLLLFELWRRLAPEKQSISILCDEMDHQMFLYDSQDAGFSNEALEDTLTSFYSALQENVDEGASYGDVFLAISHYLANDIQAFLLDYISELIASRDYARAAELLEQFYPYMPDKMWFDLLHARIVAAQDIRKGHELLHKIYLRQEVPNLEFNFDVLSFLVLLPDLDLFRLVAEQSLALIEEPDDLEDFIHILSEFYVARDEERQVKELEQLLAKRKASPHAFSADDPDRTLLSQLIKN